MNAILSNGFIISINSGIDFQKRFNITILYNIIEEKGQICNWKKEVGITIIDSI